MPGQTKESSASIPSDYCIKIPEIRWLTNERNSFLKVLEAEKAKIKEPTDLVSSEKACFLVRSWPTSCHVLAWQRGGGALWGLFCPNLIHEGSTLMT